LKEGKNYPTINLNSIKAISTAIGEENLQVKGGNIFCLDTLGDLYMN
jgi:hypothetical protein